MPTRFGLKVAATMVANSSQVAARWGEVGARMMPSWAQLEPSQAQVGASTFGPRSAILVQEPKKCARLPLLTPVERQNRGIFEVLAAVLGLCWHMSQQVGSHNARLPNMSPKMVKDGPKTLNIALKSSILGGLWGS